MAKTAPKQRLKGLQFLAPETSEHEKGLWSLYQAVTKRGLIESVGNLIHCSKQLALNSMSYQVVN